MSGSRLGRELAKIDQQLESRVRRGDARPTPGTARRRAPGRAHRAGDGGQAGAEERRRRGASSLRLTLAVALGVGMVLLAVRRAVRPRAGRLPRRGRRSLVVERRLERRSGRGAIAAAKAHTLRCCSCSGGWCSASLDVLPRVGYAKPTAAASGDGWTLSVNRSMRIRHRMRDASLRSYDNSCYDNVQELHRRRVGRARPPASTSRIGIPADTPTSSAASRCPASADVETRGRVGQARIRALAGARRRRRAATCCGASATSWCRARTRSPT